MFRWAAFLSICLLPLFSAAQENRILNKVDSLISLANYDVAKQYIQGAMQKADQRMVSLLQNKSSEVSILQGKLDEADAELATIKSNDPWIQAITESNKGFLNLNRARNDLALEMLQNAMALFQSSGKSNSLEAAQCLAHLSQVYVSTGKLNQAEENGLIALQIRQKLKGEESEEVAASYNDLGLVYGQRDPEKGLEYYEKALTVYEKIHGKEHPKIAIANTNMGLMYQKMKLYGDAITNLENAEAIWKKIYPDGHPNQAFALFDLGVTYAFMNNRTAALGYYERALAIFRKYYGEKHPDIAYVQNQIGILKLSENKYTEALSSFQDAMCSNSPSFNQKEILRNPRAKEYYNAKVMLYSLRQKALALEALHFGKTLKFEDLRNAISCLQTCDTLVDEIRYHSSDENDKLELGASANEIYEDGVRIAHTMSEMSLQPRLFEQISFYFAEKSKSAVLQESIADAEAKSFSGIPAELLDEENRLKASIALLSQKLSQKPGGDEEKKIRADIFNLNRQYEAFVKKLEKDYPDYFNLKFNAASPSIADIQKMMDDKTALVSYFIAENGHRLYSYVITRSKFKVYNSALREDFDRSIKGYNNSLYYTVFGSYKESSDRLSKLLLRGIPRGIKDLLIIPAGRLSTLPFEALTSKDLKKITEFSEVPYLINRYAISYEFSAGLLLQKSKDRPGSLPQSIFLCAPVNFPEKDHLSDLPGTESEVKNIARLFPSNAFIATGPDANEVLVKSGKIADYRYLHFATHGVVNEQSPELSRIFLQTAAAEDGNVYSGEIFNLKLNSDLTVLSACQTGLGKFSKGEGVIGLSRALLYAGSKNIMVSYWSVADESTALLMTDFYQRLLQQKNSNYREALQQAKMNMIKSGKFIAPYYWAPFVIIGF